jgi:hypothetical protein
LQLRQVTLNRADREAEFIRKLCGCECVRCGLPERIDHSQLSFYFVHIYLFPIVRIMASVMTSIATTNAMIAKVHCRAGSSSINPQKNNSPASQAGLLGSGKAHQPDGQYRNAREHGRQNNIRHGHDGSTFNSSSL